MRISQNAQHCAFYLPAQLMRNLVTRMYEKFLYCRTALGLLPLAELKAFNTAITNSDTLSDFEATVLSSFDVDY
jgi:hypothetical protein